MISEGKQESEPKKMKRASDECVAGKHSTFSTRPFSFCPARLPQSLSLRQLWPFRAKNGIGEPKVSPAVSECFIESEN